ncbi:MAG: GNAT family N-acetyltransferase [Chloroflexota bacterium]|nr:GNAT family N-acetyltransferase [Chloroflexota bacterium]
MDFAALFTNLPVLETERLLLRAYTLEDAEDVFAWTSDPQMPIFTDWEPHTTVEDSREMIRKRVLRGADGRAASFAIVLKEEAKVIGNITVMRQWRHGSMGMGYDIARAYWNRGYATEAALCAIRYCFDALGMNRVEAMCYPENEASLRVMLKTGMAYEATLREYMIIKGMYRDLHSCAILRREWSGESAPPGEQAPRTLGQPGGEITELFNRAPILETKRLRLRGLRMEDATYVYEYASDPEVARYVMFEPHQSLGESRAYLERVLSRPPGSGSINLGMEHRATGKLLGRIVLFLDSERDARGELAYALNRSYWGQGYTTEAARVVIDHGFRHLPLHRIQATCFPENEASARVLEKAGMSYEGTLRQYMLIKGKYQDLKMYSILRSEWEALP